MSAKPGRETVFTDEEVGRLVQYVIEMCDMGFGLTRQDVIQRWRTYSVLLSHFVMLRPR